MKGESKEKKIRKVRVLRRERGKRGKTERKTVEARLENVSEEATGKKDFTVAVAIRVHCFVE